MILAGDVGGTKTLLALYAERRGAWSAVRVRTFPSQEYPSLGAMIDEFLDRRRNHVDAVGVGVAGPVVDGRSIVVNLDWPVDRGALAEALGLPAARVHVLNDLEATAWGIPELPPRRLRSLAPGVKPTEGNAAVIAAGTGLGTAAMFWDGERHRPSAGEGGHQTFAPEDDVGVGLLQYLQNRYGRVSLERVVSGPGIGTIFDYLVASGRARASSAFLRRLEYASDRNAAISEAGVDGNDPAAEAAINTFVKYYGAAAGDLALILRATAGVYVGGGIAPKILPKLLAGGFVEAFRAKGRLAAFAASIPIRVVLEPRTALLGASVCARFHLGDDGSGPGTAAERNAARRRPRAKK